MPESSGIDRYQPEDLLGSAGLSDTYRARVRDQDAVVALRVLFPDRAEGLVAKAATQRFVEAGRRALASPTAGVAQVLEVADEGTCTYVVTELVPGVDLAKLVRLAQAATAGPPHGLAPTVAGLICAEVATVLGAAHGLPRPLFHLGLCPENVLVTPEGRVLLTDFGLAASLRSLGACPMAKWQYVAPELIGADVDSISTHDARAADLYALGLLMRFLLAGQGPPEAESLAELSERGWEPLPVLQGAPNNLLSAVRLLTASDPADRPESAETVVEWLSGGAAPAHERQSRIAAALRGLGWPSREVVLRQDRAQPGSPPRIFVPARASAPAATTKTAATRSRKSRPSPVLLVGAAVAIVAIATAGIVAFTRPGRQARPPDAGVAARPPGDERLRALSAETPVSPPDGGARGAPFAAPASDQVYVAQSESTPSRVPNHLFLDTNPSQADVWVDGVLRGKTPVDLVVGPGSHRVVVIKAGYRMLRAVFDTTKGDYARRALQRAGFPGFGDAVLEIRCSKDNLYPILLDDEETGLLCPVSRLPVASGKHTVGIFVPKRKAGVTVEVSVPPGRQPTRVALSD